MAILKLAPVCKDYIWGGERLIKAYDKKFSGERLAETWEVSCHEDGPSTIAEGEEEGTKTETRENFILTKHWKWLILTRWGMTVPLCPILPSVNTLPWIRF
ncbi:MAG: hypothetical protein K6C96_07080 [Butyrivibrio sp.]|nr:hypothetical protein [Butyrivibrio sp.]